MRVALITSHRQTRIQDNHHHYHRSSCHESSWLLWWFNRCSCAIDIDSSRCIRSYVCVAFAHVQTRLRCIMFQSFTCMSALHSLVCHMRVAPRLLFAQLRGTSRVKQERPRDTCISPMPDWELQHGDSGLLAHYEAVHEQACSKCVCVCVLACVVT